MHSGPLGCLSKLIISPYPLLIILSYPWDVLKTKNVIILLTFGGYQNLVLWRTITKSSLSPPWSQSGIHWTENSYEIEMDFRNFRNFDALWTTGMSEQVNNITLPIANRSKLPLGCFKNKKCIGIINIWWVPKLCFVPNNRENFPPSPWSQSMSAGREFLWNSDGFTEFSEFRRTLDYWDVETS